MPDWSTDGVAKVARSAIVLIAFVCAAISLGRGVVIARGDVGLYFSAVTTAGLVFAVVSIVGFTIVVPLYGAIRGTLLTLRHGVRRGVVAYRRSGLRAARERAADLVDQGGHRIEPSDGAIAEFGIALGRHRRASLGGVLVFLGACGFLATFVFAAFGPPAVFGIPFFSLLTLALGGVMLSRGGGVGVAAVNALGSSPGLKLEAERKNLWKLRLRADTVTRVRLSGGHLCFAQALDAFPCKVSLVAPQTLSEEAHDIDTGDTAFDRATVLDPTRGRALGRLVLPWLTDELRPLILALLERGAKLGNKQLGGRVPKGSSETLSNAAALLSLFDAFGQRYRALAQMGDTARAVRAFRHATTDEERVALAEECRVVGKHTPVLAAFVDEADASARVRGAALDAWFELDAEGAQARLAEAIARNDVALVFGLERAGGSRWIEPDVLERLRAQAASAEGQLSVSEEDDRDGALAFAGEGKGLALSDASD